MKQTILGLAMALGVFACGSTVSNAQQAKQDFTLVNQTGYSISHVFVSPSKTDDWEEDVLGRDTLEDGDSWKIGFQRASKSCIWDLKVIYLDDDSDAIWGGLDLCKISKITIHYDRKKDQTWADLK